ncbi:MAG TPA: hypothetical protein VGC13_07825 [Longimicrobium sp.]|jgi:ATP-dependent RNA helicase RhlE|uniref:hypothetical protein n=1 Tax=Longimicrobium sp. TaxID=2029185 RepID=UPI002ED7B556
MMRYDEGYGRHGGWETRMEHGDHGYDRGYRDPRQGRGGPTERPWVGGYRDGYQGGSGGYAVGTTGPLYGDRGYGGDFARHERGYRRPRGARPVDNRSTVRMRGSARDLDDSFGRGEHGDAFAYGGERGGFGGREGGGMTSRGGGYGRDFGGRPSGGGGYDRGMRGGGGGYGREFQPRPPQGPRPSRWF